jgi:hypothetical protein
MRPASKSPDQPLFTMVVLGKHFPLATFYNMPTEELERRQRQADKDRLRYEIKKQDGKRY